MNCPQGHVLEGIDAPRDHAEFAGCPECQKVYMRLPKEEELRDPETLTDVAVVHQMIQRNAARARDAGDTALASALLNCGMAFAHQVDALVGFHLRSMR